LIVAALIAGALGSGAPVLARPTATTRIIRYQGTVVRVPWSWPVYDLRRNPTLCVRFDRPAVYLGTPGRDQRCPAHVVGPHRAILIEPGRRSPEVLHAPQLPASPSHSVLARPAQVGGGVYTGLGFDACSAPSASTMSAWSSSPYRALGVYIGGVNMACAQPNLTSAWVDAEASAGWHLIPTYVGLQAPGGCCKAIVPSQAQAEGTAAANDAVAHAQAVGIGPGSPIYFDMENYTRGGTTSSAVLAFLQAWTAQLHADSYLSGVYSSGGSGITDLVSQVGTSYLEPDDIWIAHWNNQQTTSDPYVPSADWAVHQRLHQYSGGHNETYGGVTLNIDGDYLDGATAGGGTIGAPPANTAPPSVGGVPTFGNTLAAEVGTWAGTSPISYSYQWQRCASGCTNIAGATAATYTLGTADIGTRVRVRIIASNFAGHAQVTSTATGPVEPTGYWLFTGLGNVYGSVGTRGFGSPAAKHAKRPGVVGMAATADGGGYWLAGASGQIWAFGDAGHFGWTPRSQAVRGMAGDPAGGYWLFTASGNIYRAGGARSFGSPAAHHARNPEIVGMAGTADGGGYWLVGASGRIWAFGDAARLGWTPRPQPVAGIVADPTGGYWLFTASGSIYRAGGAGWFGSPAANRARRPAIVGMAATTDGGGYWLVGASGRVWAYGDAARLPALRHAHPIVGMAGP
jgi:Rv2525c-like, glycoside hydrolase-like domain